MLKNCVKLLHCSQFAMTKKSSKEITCLFFIAASLIPILRVLALEYRITMEM